MLELKKVFELKKPIYQRMFPLWNLDQEFTRLVEWTQENRIEVKFPTPYLENTLATRYKNWIRERIRLAAIDLAADLFLKDKERKAKGRAGAFDLDLQSAKPHFEKELDAVLKKVGL